eukprot:scaffold1986_cov174-Alexandrium_tamarense.AAC.2
MTHHLQLRGTTQYRWARPNKCIDVGGQRQYRSNGVRRDLYHGYCLGGGMKVRVVSSTRSCWTHNGYKEEAKTATLL